MYKIGQKVKLLNSGKKVIITKLDVNGIPIEGTCNGEIISLINKVFVVLSFFRYLLRLFKISKY